MDEGTSRSCTMTVLCGRTSLLLIMTGYAIFGAVLFRAIEGEDLTNDTPPLIVQKSREDCLKELWLITERLNVLYEKNWTRLVTAQLKRFEKAVVDAGKTEGNFKFSNNSTWTYSGALLYSITLLTTVGYGRLTPKTTLGKMVTIIYALFGVPLMLVLLSELGSMFAVGATKGYRKLCCKHDKSTNDAKNDAHSSVGYHKAPSSPSGKNYYKNNEDSASIQLASCRNNQNQHSTPSKHPLIHNTGGQHYVEYHHHHHLQHEVPKRAVLATVRSGRTRGGCRQTAVRQMLVDPSLCPQHCHGPPIVKNCAYAAGTVEELEGGDDLEENDHLGCTHDTPSRIPLIWKPQPEEGRCEHQDGADGTSSYLRPSVPASLVLVFFVSYICAGAAALVTANGWNFLEGVYFCFLALTTIGVGDKLPQSADLNGQLQSFACCVYLFIGLIVIAMCFSLIQDEITNKFRQIAGNVAYFK